MGKLAAATIVALGLGFLAGWLRGETLERCLLLGAACGSLSTTAFGGFGGQPTWEEANALIRASRH